MSEALVPTITRAGLAACRNAQGTGLLATVVAIAIGTGAASPAGPVGYVPTGRETALKAERVRVPLLSGQHLGAVGGSAPIGFRVLAEVPPLTVGTAAYPVNEVGFFLSDGTLLCLWSDPAVILQFMTDRASLELAFDLLLEQLPAGSVTFQVERPDIPDTLASQFLLLAAQSHSFANELVLMGRSLS